MDELNAFSVNAKTERKKQDRFSFFSLSALIGLILFCVFILLKRQDFFDRFSYELKRPFTWDTTMYYAIGKGMTQGLKPYVDMFETKPPMIFFLAAISYGLTEDFYLCNLFSFVCLLLTTLAPVVCVTVKLIQKREKSLFVWSLYLLAALAVGLLIGGYDQLRSGEVQVELFGAFFIIAYLLLARTVNSEKAKLYSPKIIFSALLLMIGVLFKEPFLLIALAGATLFCSSARDWWYKFLLPCAYGGVAGVLVLAFTGTLIPYFNTYLPHMMGNHISIYGSPFERMKQFDKVLSDVSNYSPVFLGIVLLSILISVVTVLREKTPTNAPFYQKALCVPLKLVRIFIAPLLVSFSVGLGGQYYNHHYIFALPCYVLCIILSLESAYVFFATPTEEPSVDEEAEARESLLLKTLARIGKITLGALTAFSLVGIYLLPQPDYKHYEKILAYAESMKADAAYLDEAVDRLDEDTYQYFGFNGPILYAYTKHSPLGPVFFQDPKNLEDENSFFAKSLIEQMSKADVYVVSYVRCGVLTEYVNTYIQENFTLLQDSEKASLVSELEKPSSFGYKIYVRNV